jgi:hypothetical protein
MQNESFCNMVGAVTWLALDLLLVHAEIAEERESLDRHRSTMTQGIRPGPYALCHGWP